MIAVSEEESRESQDLPSSAKRRSASPRVAIFHDYMSSIGGGEKSMLCLAKAFDADVITTDFSPDVLKLADAQNVRVIDLGRLLTMAPVRQIHASLRFAAARFDDYDFHIFSGNWSRYAGKNHQPNLFFCHTPVRAFYDLRGKFLNGLPPWKRFPAWVWVTVHSRCDERSVRHMNLIVVNSENVRRRVMRYYGREALVVPPPVVTSRFRYEEVGDYWLSVNRFYPEKRIDMQVEIFRRLPKENLVIVGDHEREETARQVASQLRLPPNVTLAGAVDQGRLEDLYAHCKGLITTAVDEDTGLTPIEAMASGKAVLATDEGGYRETVVNGDTGWLLPVDVRSFVEKIQSLKAGDLEAMKDRCIARAAAYDESVFIEKIQTLVTSGTRTG